MLSKLIRSRTARGLGALLGAVALCAALPATAFADRDGRGWRNERSYDHGRRDHGRGHTTRHFRPAYRRAYGVHRHGPSCPRGPVYRHGYRPYYRPYATFGWSFGR
jgi:hypothetical protein